jgi:hypothetical protein
MEIKLTPAERDLLRRYLPAATLFACLCSAEDKLRLTCDEAERWLLIDVCARLLLEVGIDGVGKLTAEGRVIDGLIGRIFPL